MWRVCHVMSCENVPVMCVCVSVCRAFCCSAVSLSICQCCIDYQHQHRAEKEIINKLKKNNGFSGMAGTKYVTYMALIQEIGAAKTEYVSFNKIIPALTPGVCT